MGRQLIGKPQVVQEKEESDLDKVLKALTVAKTLTGTVADVSGIYSAKAKNEAEAMMKQNELSLKSAEEARKKELLPFEIEKLKSEAEKNKRGPDIDPTVKALRDMALSGKIEEMKREKLERNVPGFEAAPGFQPTKDDIKGIKDLSEANKNIGSSADRLSELIKEHGVEVSPGEVKDEMGQLVGDLQLKIKDMAKLGQLTSGDFALLRSQIPDPTSFTAALRRAGQFVTGENVKESFLTKLAAFKKLANEKVANAAKARGFVVGEPITTEKKKSIADMSTEDLMKMKNQMTGKK